MPKLRTATNQALLKLFRLDRIPAVKQAQSTSDKGGAVRKELDQALSQLGLQSQMMSAYGAYMATEVDRLRQYKEYDMMDEESEVITTALDIYTEDATAYDSFVGARVWVTSNQEKLGEEINEFLKKLKLESSLPRIARNLAKYGDFFLKLGVRVKKNDEDKVAGVTSLDTSYWPGDVIPVVKQRKLLGYLVMQNQVQQMTSDSLFAPWQFVHFAIPGDSNFYRLDTMVNYQYVKREDMVEYGQSLLKAARRPHKRSKLMHDILAITRLTRSPLKRVFKFMTETSNPVKAITDLAVFKKTMEKIGGIDKINETLNYEELLNIITTDIYLPIMKESKGDFTVDTIGGEVDVSQIVDVELFDNRLFMAIRIPKEHLNFGAVTDHSAALLKDIRYAKRINRLQTSMRSGIRELVFIHYALQGRVLKEADFEVNMTSVSISEDLERLDYFGNAVQTADSLMGLLEKFSEGMDTAAGEGKKIKGKKVQEGDGDMLGAREADKDEPAATDAPGSDEPTKDGDETGADKETGKDEPKDEPKDAAGDAEEPKDEPEVKPLDNREKLDKGYLVYYILKHVVKLPSFDLRVYYPGAEKYEKQDVKTEKARVAQRVVENNKTWIDYTFKKNFMQDLHEAAEAINQNLEKPYLTEAVPENFKFEEKSLVEYFNRVIEEREREDAERKKKRGDDDDE